MSVASHNVHLQPLTLTSIDVEAIAHDLVVNPRKRISHARESFWVEDTYLLRRRVVLEIDLRRDPTMQKDLLEISREYEGPVGLFTVPLFMVRRDSSICELSAIEMSDTDLLNNSEVDEFHVDLIQGYALYVVESACGKSIDELSGGLKCLNQYLSKLVYLSRSEAMVHYQNLFGGEADADFWKDGIDVNFQECLAYVREHEEFLGLVRQLIDSRYIVARLPCQGPTLRQVSVTYLTHFEAALAAENSHRTRLFDHDPVGYEVPVPLLSDAASYSATFHGSKGSYVGEHYVLGNDGDGTRAWSHYGGKVVWSDQSTLGHVSNRAYFNLADGRQWIDPRLRVAFFERPPGLRAYASIVSLSVTVLLAVYLWFLDDLIQGGGTVNFAEIVFLLPGLVVAATRWIFRHNLRNSSLAAKVSLAASAIVSLVAAVSLTLAEISHPLGSNLGFDDGSSIEYGQLPTADLFRVWWLALLITQLVATLLICKRTVDSVRFFARTASTVTIANSEA